jgi:hypothetical protein
MKMKRAPPLTALLLAFPLVIASTLRGQSGTNGGYRVYPPASSARPSSPESIFDNQSIAKLVKAGLGEDVIVGIVNSRPGKYALGADDIVSLKQQKVPDKVILAMLAKSSSDSSKAPPVVTVPPVVTALPVVTAPPVVATPPVVSARPAETPIVPSKPEEVGVYYRRDDKWVDLKGEIVHWKTGGVVKHVASVGVVKEDINGLVNGSSSPNLLKTPLEFLVYSIEGVGASEYQLVKLHVHEDNREFRTITGGVFHVSEGAMRDSITFSSTKVAPRLYRITISSLQTGEYGLLPPNSEGPPNRASASLGKIYSFRVQE